MKFTKPFTKLVIASALGLTLAFGVVAAEKQHQTIIIKADHNGPAEVTVSQNDDVQVFTISQAALKDTELLLAELAGTSEELIEHISQALSGLHTVSGAHIKVSIDETDALEHGIEALHQIVEEIHVSSDGVKDGENYAFITIDDDNDISENYKMIIKKVKGLHHDSKSGAAFEAIQHLLKKSDLTAEQLDTLQGLLDSKR